MLPASWGPLGPCLSPTPRGASPALWDPRVPQPPWPAFFSGPRPPPFHPDTRRPPVGGSARAALTPHAPSPAPSRLCGHPHPAAGGTALPAAAPRPARPPGGRRETGGGGWHSPPLGRPPCGRRPRGPCGGVSAGRLAAHPAREGPARAGSGSRQTCLLSDVLDGRTRAAWSFRGTEVLSWPAFQSERGPSCSGHGACSWPF